MTGAADRVLLFGTFDAARHPRVEVLAEGLDAAGYRVDRCNLAWRASTAERVAALRNPLVAARLVLRLLGAWVGLWRRARRLADPEVVVVGYLGVLDVHLARRLWPRAVIVLDHLAPVGGIVADRAAGARLRARVAGWVDARATATADVVVVDTEEHAVTGTEVVVPVGAPAAWFDARAKGHGTGGGVADVDAADGTSPAALRVVFFGLYTPLHGAVTVAEALRAVAAAGVDLEVRMLGTGQDRAAAEARAGSLPGVVWQDWVDPARLPAVVADHDVCLGIFGTTPKAARVVPNKVFQGAAAGCAVLTSDTAPQRRLLGDAAGYVPAGDPAALAAALTALAVDRRRCDDARVAAAGHADAAFRPTAVVAPLRAALEHHLAGHGGRHDAGPGR